MFDSGVLVPPLLGAIVFPEGNAVKTAHVARLRALASSCYVRPVQFVALLVMA